MQLPMLGTGCANFITKGFQFHATKRFNIQIREAIAAQIFDVPNSMPPIIPLLCGIIKKSGQTQRETEIKMVFNSFVDAIEAARSLAEDDEADQNENEFVQLWKKHGTGGETEKQILAILDEAKSHLRDGTWW